MQLRENWRRLEPLDNPVLKQCGLTWSFRILVHAMGIAQGTLQKDEAALKLDRLRGRSTKLA